MRKLLIAFTIALFAGASTIEATTYRLFVHGRSSTNHCNSITSTGSGTVDVGGYWSGWGYVPNVSNVRYVGFHGEESGGAYSWSNCGAQSQLYKALNTFCTGSNDCEIYTHSTGGLVVSAFFGKYPFTSSWYNIRRVQLMANASGGSELADAAIDLLGWMGWSNYGGELDHSVSVSGARNGFDHNQSGGLTYYTTSGEGKDSETLYLTWAILPGIDDGVVANHSLCGINNAADVEASCARGNGRLRESYTCWSGWNPFATCYRYYFSWSPYYRVYQGGGGHSHSDAKSDYNRR